MKLIDFSLIFVAVFLPIVIITYVNTSFVVKSEKNEMYYKSIINSATKDAVTAMKQVENSNIDYGYSGIVNNKVSINAKEAINTFYSSLANNFEISDNESALERLKMYIPVIAVIDYDGIYIHSLEEMSDGNLEFVTKPKIKYTLTYVIKKGRTDLATGDTTYEIVDVTEKDNAAVSGLLTDYMYEINFTMDDYVYLKIYNTKTKEITLSKGFYLTDNNNNSDLIFADNITSYDEKKLKSEIIKYLTSKRKNIIAELGMKHISYAINKHNEYARLSDIKYKFTFSVTSDDSWYETMDGIGMIAVVQGISLGSKYLNYSSYSASDLTEAKKYYVSVSLDTEDERYYLKYNLYHASEKCDVYGYYLSNVEELTTPTYYLSKSDAATQGYYSCPICKP